MYRFVIAIVGIVIITNSLAERVYTGWSDFNGKRNTHSNNSQRRVKITSSNLAYPQFGRRQDAYGIVSVNGKFIRPTIERWKDYWHNQLVRRPFNEVSQEAMEIWRRKNIKYAGLEEFNRGTCAPYLKRFYFLVNMLEQISAECFRYNLQQKCSRPCEIVNMYFSDQHLWRQVLVGQYGAILRMNKDFAILEEHINERMDELDNYHKAEFAIWVRSNEDKYALIRKEVQKQVDEQKNIEFRQNELDKLRRMLAEAQKKIQSAEERAKDAEDAAAAAHLAAEEAEKHAEEEGRRAASAEGHAGQAEYRAKQAEKDVQRLRDRFHTW